MIDRTRLTPFAPLVVHGNSVYPVSDTDPTGPQMSVYASAHDDGQTVSGYVWFLSRGEIARSTVAEILTNADGSITLSGPGIHATSAADLQEGTLEMTLVQSGTAFTQSAQFTPNAGGSPLVLSEARPFAGGFAIEGPAAA